MTSRRRRERADQRPLAIRHSSDSTATAAPFRVHGLGFMVYGLGVMVYGLWFMVYVLWVMVDG